MKKRYQNWLESGYISQKDRIQLKKMTKMSDIEECFGGELHFGTAGMRGELGLGPNRMNRYMIGKAVQAALTANKDATPLVVIAYDTRRNSESFAREAARVVLGNGGRVALFDAERPVPELSFAVRKINAALGIMITASHNPPEYNGIKIYGADGAQMIPELMQATIQAFQQLEDLSMIERESMKSLHDHPDFRYLGEEMDEAYLAYCLSQSKRKKVDCSISVVYTPLHGAGNRLVRRLLSRRGFANVWTVTSQERPDPDFSTVTTPNPEESEALRLAVQCAVERKADLVIATDPDCDRVGVVIMDKGQAIPLNGNQIGALLLNYLINQTKEIPRGATVVKSIVTSDLGAKIAQRNGLICEETLTGFKYIGEKMEAFSHSQDRSFFFGYEESYGYLTGTEVRDKDGVLAAMLIVEMASFYRCHGVSLHGHLQEIYHDFGAYREDIDSFVFKGIRGPERMKSLMNAFRTNSPLKDVQRDLIDYLSSDTGLPQENVVKVFMDHAWIVLRPSGTEPKLKCYYSTWAENEDLAEKKLMALQSRIRAFIENEFDK